MIKIHGLEQHQKHASSIKIEAAYDNDLDLLGANITLSFCVNYYNSHLHDAEIEGVLVEFMGKMMAAEVQKRGEVFKQNGCSRVNINIKCDETNIVKVA